MVIAGQYPYLSFTFGIMGDISLLVVFLLPTFWAVYKKKTTEEFQSLPYVVGLFSSMLWIYYGTLKDGAVLLITIRSVGIFTQTFYLGVFVFYAPKRPRMECLMLILMFIVIGFGLIVLPTQFLTKGHKRDVIAGWIFLVLSSLCVFVSPLGFLTQVTKTKRVKYMPMLVVVSVTLSGVMWFFYGLLHGDINIVIPNALGFTLGIIQIVYYFVYKNEKPDIDDNIMENEEQMNENTEPRVPEVKNDHTIDMAKLNAPKTFQIYKVV